MTVGTARKLIRQDRILPDETTVLCITGNGLKTTDVLADQYQAEIPISPKLSEFEAYLAARLGDTRVTAPVGRRPALPQPFVGASPALSLEA